MTQYQVITDRQTLALYLAWEIGISHANALLKQAEKITAWGYKVPLSHNTTRLKQQAQNVCQRIAQAASFQEGRLGRKCFRAPLFAIIRS